MIVRPVSPLIVIRSDLAFDLGYDESCDYRGVLFRFLSRYEAFPIIAFLAYKRLQCLHPSTQSVGAV